MSDRVLAPTAHARLRRRRHRSAPAQLPHRLGSRTSSSWARLAVDVGRHVRAGLLRHRDDGQRRVALRPGPVRHGGLPGLAPPGRHHDRGRPVSQKMAPVLRQVYDQMMEPKWVISMGVCASTRRHVQQLRHRAGRRSGRARSTSTPRAARPRPRRSSTPSRRCARMIGDGELLRRRAATGGGAGVHLEPAAATTCTCPGRHRPSTPVSDATATEVPESADPAPEPERLHGCLGQPQPRPGGACTPPATTTSRCSRRSLDDGYELCADLVRRRPPHQQPPRPARRRRRRALRGGRSNLVDLADAAAHAGAAAGARGRSGRAVGCSTSGRAPRRWSARCSTCSASASTATPTSPAS